MPGRLLIADDRFASRLMLSALFSGAYYDVIQADRPSTALAAARADRPGAIILRDGFGPDGAIAFCHQLKADPATADCLRIIMTDRTDPDRTVKLIAAGVDDVLCRSYGDEELLARVEGLLHHRGRVADLQLRFGPDRDSGLAEATAGFSWPSRIALVSPAQDAPYWAETLTRTLRHRNIAPVQVGTGTGSGAALPDASLFVVDGPGLGREQALRLIARLAARPDPASCLLAVGPDDSGFAAQGLRVGASGILRGALDGAETTARVGLQLDRLDKIDRLRADLSQGLRSAVIDPLTRLYNRRFAMPRLQRLLHDLRRTGQPATIIMADLDYFKWINDRFGHSAGDTILSATGGIIAEHTPTEGFAVRMGGEEFLIALPGTDQAAARIMAEKLREAICGTVFAHPRSGTGLRTTISIGISTMTCRRLPPFLAAEDEIIRWISEADSALYQAKHEGRNRVAVAAEQPPTRSGTWAPAPLARSQLAGS
ncbi:diguanylate cyclase [Pseudooceanicola sp. C21-150M6]|uniref:diguanylate cyclase n=1 Tax=Pseudooceanicola sp. C21-150M6 TaxID=3434355 RepID=UPI003D7FBDC9